MWIGFDNIVLNFFATFNSASGLQITVLKSLIQWSFSNPLWLYIVEPCLSPAKQICSFMYHLIKFGEMVWLSLIQSLFFTHLCYSFFVHTVILTPSGVFKGRRARHLPRSPLFGGPLRCYARKFSLFLVKNLLSTHIMYYKADHK